MCRLYYSDTSEKHKVNLKIDDEIFQQICEMIEHYSIEKYVNNLFSGQPNIDVPETITIGLMFKEERKGRLRERLRFAIDDYLDEFVN